MKIIGFAGSNSKKSINKSLVQYTSTLFESASIELLDLNDYEVETFGIDKLDTNGVPSKIIALANKIDNVNLLVISLAEHNGTYSSAFKNIYDWLSVIPNRKVLGKTPVLLLATSPGDRGGAGVLKAAIERFPIDGSEILESFSLPNFDDNFKDENISNITLRLEIIQKVNKIKSTKFEAHYKDQSFTCGIDPDKNDCGDAIEY